LNYTISFIRTNVDALDNTKHSDDRGESTESPPSLQTTTDTLITHLHLGSFKEETTVAQFADGSTGNGLTYPVFRKMLENFLNKFYTAHDLPRERYIGVQGDQKVISELLQLCANF
jgi:hypothetical protein